VPHAGLCCSEAVAVHLTDPRFVTRPLAVYVASQVPRLRKAEAAWSA
jgi:hypothetical protein